MTRKEQKIRERAWQLYREHEDWGEWKAFAAAVAEETRKSKVRGAGRCRMRPIGLLGWNED